MSEASTSRGSAALHELLGVGVPRPCASSRSLTAPAPTALVLRQPPESRAAIARGRDPKSAPGVSHAEELPNTKNPIWPDHAGGAT
jgi:hypothetical protein